MSISRSGGVRDEEWGQPVEAGESWDRSAVPFHVVLIDESGEGSKRWSQAGAVVRALV